MNPSLPLLYAPSEPKNPLSAEIGKRLKELRQHRRMSQEKLALILGLQQPSLSLIESGKVLIRADYLQLICQRLRVSYEWMIDGTGTPDRAVAQAHLLPPGYRAIPIQPLTPHLALRTPLAELSLYFPNRVAGADVAFQIESDDFAPCFYQGDFALAIASRVQEAQQIAGFWVFETQTGEPLRLVATDIRKAHPKKLRYRTAAKGRLISQHINAIGRVWQVVQRLGQV
jgi:transcriptional regulator with XRE-family HTH domain